MIKVRFALSDQRFITLKTGQSFEEIAKGLEVCKKKRLLFKLMDEDRMIALINPEQVTCVDLLPIDGRDYESSGRGGP